METLFRNMAEVIQVSQEFIQLLDKGVSEKPFEEQIVGESPVPYWQEVIS